MNKKLIALFLVVFVGSLLLSACERPAPIPPTVATATADIPFPIPNQATLPVGQIGTQTAIAQTTPGIKVLTPVPTTGQGQQPAKTQQAPQPTSSQPKPTQAPPKPTSTPKPAVVIATPARPSTYTIQSGDTFYCIARRYNLNVGDFLSLNGLGNSSLAQIGQVVKIPSSGTWGDGSRSLHAHPDTYTVDAGDTLNKIACYYGDVYPEVILEANNLKSASDIQAGMQLDIP